MKVYSLFKADLHRYIYEKKYLWTLIIPFLIVACLGIILKDKTNTQGVNIILKTMSMINPLFFSTICHFFIGEDFSSRTINNLIIKFSRNKIFFYKSISTIIYSMFFIFYVYTIILLLNYFFFSYFNFSFIFKLFFYQFPYYVGVVSLCIFIFNYVDKIVQAFVIYLIFAISFDDLFLYVFGNVIDSKVIEKFLLFYQLKNIDIEKSFFNLSLWIVIIFIFTFLLLSYFLFNTREFK